MLPPWFKRFLARRELTLAISPQGIALRKPGQVAQLLTDANESLATMEELKARLVPSLTSQQKLLSNQPLRVVISNAYTRYLLLPWQPNVYHRQDWEAIAQHAFRQQFGNVATTWQVRVHLGAYGQPLLAVAVDEALVDLLTSSAKALDINLTAIEPAFTQVLNQASDHQDDWTMMVEPARILLLQASHGRWQQMSLATPPAGQECEHSQQLVSRALLQVDSVQRPHRVVTHVSAAVRPHWQHNADSLLRLTGATKGTLPHAAWLAGL